MSRITDSDAGKTGSQTAISEIARIEQAGLPNS